MKAEEQRQNDRPRPPVRAALPFRVFPGIVGPEVEWDETHTILGEHRTMPIRFGGNNAVAFFRIGPRILELVKLFRKLEDDNHKLMAENERLQTQLIEAVGEKEKVFQEVKALRGQLKTRKQ